MYDRFRIRNSSTDKCEVNKIAVLLSKLIDFVSIYQLDGEFLIQNRTLQI